MMVLLAYLFYFIAASASPLQRRWLAVQKGGESSGQLHFAFQVMAVTVLLSFFFPFFSPFYLSGNALNLVLLTLASGVFGGGYFWANYTAQKHVEAGVSSIVSNIYTPITIVLATFFLHEGLTGIQLIGTAFLLTGMVIVSKKHRTGRFTFDKYFWLMLASGAMLGISLTAERALQVETGFAAGTMFSWWAQFAALGVAAFITRSRHAYSTADTLVTGVLRSLQSLSWVVLIFVVGNLSLVSSITTFKVVIVFAAAALFLKERDDLSRKILGSVIALAGLLLMK
jgi:drug/metabolite transporter (DMT)-like permease